MLYYTFLWLTFISNIPYVLSQSTATTLSSSKLLNKKPSITQFLVFSTSSETIIPFEPKNGWILNEEKKLRLYISGTNLQNSSIVFSETLNECSPSDFVSPVYPLSSASIIELNVNLKSVLNAHSSIFPCLLSSPLSVKSKSNKTQIDNSIQLEGPYFTLLREKSRLPFAAKICLILMLFLVSGFFSGLNLGLMSLSVNDLRLIAESEDSSMRHYAKRVLPLRRRGNYLLCSIVIANVLVNSLGTVLLDSLVHGIFAVIGSTVMIVLMGEIIPQAICSRYGLVIGSHTHVITWMCMFITGIISYPLGFILDKILGQEVTSSYTRDQIAGMLTRISADIEKPELDVITGVLSLRKKTVKEAMTWLPDVYMLDSDRKTDAELLLDVHKHGFSRIPVYSNEKPNIIGIVKLRDFALITPEQYHLTVKNLLEFHTHSYGYAKITDSLYGLMQEFLKSRWHMALVQELQTDEDNIDPVYATAGIITLEDVIEEMLQREIIEETDFFTDNRRKIQRKQAKTMDYTALVKRPVKGPSISPQLKVAVFQFLNTNIHQFTSGFISQEILQILLNYNVYATIKRQANQSTNSIYLYKKGFRYELFTLIIQGNATLESGAERIMSTVGPFSYFATSSLLAEHKSVKDIHDYLDRLCVMNSRTNNITDLLDEISSIFIPDYNLIINSELQILQIHRLVWLAAVRATQRQRGHNSNQKRLQPEQLLSNALDEISSVTNIPIDKNNLTNFQRVFRNIKDIPRHPTQITNGNPDANGEPSSPSVFNAINSLNIDEKTNVNEQQEFTNTDKNSLEKHVQLVTAMMCNPLLLSQPSDDQPNGNALNNGNCNTSSTSNSLNEGVFNSNMHINRMFDDAHEHTFDDDHGQEKEYLIGQGHYKNHAQQQQQTTLPSNLFHARSDTDILMTHLSPNGNEILNNNNNNESIDQPRRARSMLSTTKCVPS
ncbi:unnamed protein product [Adineta steineri]|uniref:CNNM transmembrane domain-containing protein n=1 Tax=Adineta steineri TaxID=433720 RepID=A0A813M4N2_9BILA|nr:unnamed protein product [Adineta steineri]